MVKWNEMLRMDDYVRKHERKVLTRLKSGKLLRDIYCIMPASYPSNLLDIVGSNELLFEHYKRNDWWILGIAKTRDSAMELAQEILMEQYKTTGRFRPASSLEGEKKED